MPYIKNGLDPQIWRVLKREGPLSTRELADKVKSDTKTVYQRCRKMEREFDEWMASESRSADRPLYFFPTTGDVLTHSNHEQIEHAIEDLKEIARKHEVKRGAQLSGEVKNAMRRDYHAYLKNLAGRPTSDRQQIAAFEGQLMAVLGGTTLSDVVGFFGLRRFWPKMRVWRLQGSAPASLPDVPRLSEPKQ